MTKKNKIIIAIISIFLIIGIAVTIFMNLDNKKTVELYTVTEQAPITFSGSAKPVDSQDIYVDATKGKISQFYVQDGDTVVVGQDLFIYENREMIEGVEDLTRAYNTALSSYNAASGQLGKSQNDLAAVRNRIGDLEYKINNYSAPKPVTPVAPVAPPTTPTTPVVNPTEGSTTEPTSAVNSVNPIPPVNTGMDDLASLKAELEAAKAEKQGYESSISGMEDGVRQAKAALDDNSARLTRAKNKMNYIEKSKVAGKVKLDKDIADSPIAATEPILSIKSGDIVVKAQVSEYDYDKIKVDDVVKLTVINSDRTLKGKVSKIEEEPISNSAGQMGMAQQKTSNISNYSFDVIPEEPIQHGFSVNIKLSKEEVYIPKEAVEKDNGKFYVYIVEDGVTVKKSIDLIEEKSLYKLKGGIKLGEKIVANVEGITEGMEVEVNIVEDENNLKTEPTNTMDNSNETNVNSTEDNNSPTNTNSTDKGMENDSN